MKKLFPLCVVMLAVAAPAQANKMAMVAPACGMQEQVTISVNYNFKAKSFADAKKMFDEQNARVTDFAKQQKLGKFDMQNQNYNIYSQPTSYRPDGMPDSYSYQLTGSTTYQLDNANAAFKFAEFLSQQNIQVGLNSNSYRNGNVCPAAVAE